MCFILFIIYLIIKIKNMIISNCCGAKVIYFDDKFMTGMCCECKEWCEAEEENESEFCNGKMD